MARRSARLHLEQLGSRILLSASPLAPAAILAATAPVALVAPAPTALDGKGRGDWSRDAVQSGAGIETRLHGTADLAGIGPVQVDGWVRSVGFIQHGRATGELTFSDARGSVTVELEGPLQAGFSRLPEHFRYRIAKASGDFAGLSAGGTLALALDPALSLNGDGPHGTFRLAIWPRRDHPASGIKGVALVGPTVPVGRPGQPDERPLPGAVIEARLSQDGPAVARAVADAEGRFALALPPGKYLLVPLPPHPGDLLPIGTPQTVTVRPGDMGWVAVHYDSGLRWTA